MLNVSAKTDFMCLLPTTNRVKSGNYRTAGKFGHAFAYSENQDE